MYPHARDCVSTCTWLYIYMHVAVYPRARSHVSMWSCIHMHVAVYPRQNLAMHYGPYCSAESGSALWATAQNFVKRISHSAESGSALWATADNFIKSYGHGAESLTTEQNH